MESGCFAQKSTRPNSLIFTPFERASCFHTADLNSLYLKLILIRMSLEIQGSEELLTFTSFRGGMLITHIKKHLVPGPKLVVRTIKYQCNMKRCERNILLETGLVKVLVVPSFNYFRRRLFPSQLYGSTNQAVIRNSQV